MLTFNDLKVKHINEAEDDVEMRLAKQKDLARGTTPWALMVDCVRGLLDRRVRRDSRSRLSRHSSNVASRLYRVLDTSHEDFWEAHVFDTLQLRPATGFTCAHLGPSPYRDRQAVLHAGPVLASPQSPVLPSSSRHKSAFSFGSVFSDAQDTSDTIRIRWIRV
ncbi:uncharacterized protein NECHADRAFT_87189 [Fusarium vanettenii 77-13-4]|uniref:Uncharacterized protein n=1 Tax=Fusarium vanettenii (strain ATCC MYA-4622 / CBS 123669 / FGSC 9596 / NRRL 45880 / 77-13-4) TaxID=660122 RepID=C7ZIL8_FUSV7|nr:uncharacterized protein NECHADRAFT_87189 [Fusarium vanettenii 77-13-4]EEU36111.1 predicted protein [Fusarium vanettenii 77-13-4]